MVDIGVVYTIIEKETKEGLYIISTGLVKYVTYARNKNELKNLKSQKELLNDELLESKSIYLLKNINELLHNAEEKTKKIIKHIMINEELLSNESLNLDIIKIFILMLITYITYREIYFTAIVRDPTLIDFFKEKDVKLRILQNLFYYLLEHKKLSSKLNISEKYNKIRESFEEIDKDKNIFNKETIDPHSVLNLFKKVKEKLLK